jgi:hypothetical protein
MEGKARLEDQNDSIRSACRLPIYQAASAILEIESKEGRGDALSMHPEAIRPHIEWEVRRLWKRRRE